jgi:DNA-binding beta-propeller fold protein YncE
LAVSEWGDKSIVILDAKTLQTKERFATLEHPTSLVYHSDGRLFVSESGSNTIIQIRDHVVSRVTVSMDTQHPVGPTPNGIALSKDGASLYVTLSGENAVAVLDVAGDRPLVKGHIPTERWPSLVAVSPDGKKLLIGTAKGLSGPSEVNGNAFPAQARRKNR